MYPPSYVPVAMLLEEGRVSHSLLGQAAGSVVLGTWNWIFILFTFLRTYDKNIYSNALYNKK